MARTTSKTKASTPKSPAATSTTPVVPSDDSNPTTMLSSAASQETSTPVPVQVTALNLTKKTKPLAGSKNVSLDHAALLARLAEKEAEIDKLRKASQSMTQDAKPKEIKRPEGSIANLQKAMGLENDRALYMNCRSTISDVLAHAGIPLAVDWRRQDPIALGKVASVAKSRSKQLQLYDKNWAALEIMKTIIKNKRSYRSKIGRPYKEDQNSGSQQGGNAIASGSGSGDQSGASDVDANNEKEQFSNSDESGDEENGTSAAASAGTKRKATGSGGKGKQRKV